MSPDRFNPPRLDPGDPSQSPDTRGKNKTPNSADGVNPVIWGRGPSRNPTPNGMPEESPLPSSESDGNSPADGVGPGSTASGIGSGAYPNPVPAMSAPGSSPYWQANWDRMWTALIEAEFTCAHLQELERKISRIRADLRDSPNDAELRAYLGKLVALGQPPTPTSNIEGKRLHACGSDVGLILMWADNEILQKACEEHLPVACHMIPDDGPCMLHVEVSIPIKRQQAPYWAWAAQDCALLFESGDD